MKIQIEVNDDIINAIANKTAEIMESKAEEIPAKDIPADNKNKLYSVKEVADLLNCSKITITRHIGAGLLKAAKPGKSFVITYDNLQKYINLNNQ